MRTGSYLTCEICKQQKRKSDGLPSDFIRLPILEKIKKQHPDLSEHAFVCFEDLNNFRAQHVQEILELDKGELSSIEESVLRSLRNQEILSENPNVSYEKVATFGERLADKIAEFGGSWKFISIFFLVIGSWVVLNVHGLTSKPFDPYPYILLNLVLSCLAAIQAPVIMMSQNRQEDKDRMRSEMDYRVNLKAELEIQHLKAKLDQLLFHQWQHLLEVQQIQMDLIKDMTQKR